MKQFTINVDIKDKIVGNNDEKPLYNQGDINTAILNINITQDETVYNLTNSTVSLFFQKDDGTIVYQDTTSGLTITDMVNGKISVSLNTQTLTYPGKVKGAVKIQNGTTTIETQPFYFYVQKSLTSEQTLQSDNSLSPLLGTATLTTTAKDIKGGINEVNAQLAQIVQQGINIKSPPTGSGLTPAKGDGTTDDTAAVSAILNYAYQNNLMVYVPPGTYKITSTIVIDHNLSYTPSLHIIGSGNTFSTKNGENASRFIGYNIADKRGIFEFTGRGVNQATGVTMEYIGFDMDYNSCGQLAFDLIIGDANVPTFRKCSFYGFNNLLFRCGTAPDYTGYIFSCALFEQCYFNTNRYIDWDETTVLPKAQFGFCVAPEHLFVTHALANIWDNVTFSECNFLGSVYQYGTVNYRNCMWQIPGDYKPQMDVTNDARFNTTFLPDKTINCEIGVVVLGGKAHLYDPYFEDVRMCLATFKNGNGISCKIIVENPIANATLNTIATVGGVVQNPQYFLQTFGTNYTVDYVEIKGGTYSVGNHGGFQQGFVVNNIAQRLIVSNVAGVTEDIIVDNYSRTKHFEGINASDNNGTLIELTATGTASVYGKLLNFDGFLNYFNVPCHAIIKEISVILPSTETSGYLGFVQFDSFANTPGTVYTDCNAGNVHTNISFTDTNYITTDTIGSSVRYAVKNYPDIVTNQYQRLWYLKKGKKLGVYTTLSDNASVTIKVKLLV